MIRTKVFRVSELQVAHLGPVTSFGVYVAEEDI
jgi:hypothetical protein